MRGRPSFVGSAKESVEVAVRADPSPSDLVARALADGAEVCADADGPEVIVSTEFLATKRGVRRIFSEDAKRLASGGAHGRVQLTEGAPKAWSGG